MKKQTRWNQTPDALVHPEPTLDQKRIDDYYTLVLRKRFGTTNSDLLREAVEAKGIHMRVIEAHGEQYVTIIDRKHHVLGQLSLHHFFKKHETK